MKTKPNNNMSSQNGFTLLEIMIAMVIFAVGLLGLAGMQSIAFQNEHSSYSRSQAILLAYEMADRIKANPPGSATYVLTTTTADDGAYTGTTMCTAATCTPANMVISDIGIWRASVASLLPGGLSAITRTVAGTEFTHQITVHWDEDRTGVTGIDCPPDDADDLRCFQISVEL